VGGDGGVVSVTSKSLQRDNYIVRYILPLRLQIRDEKTKDSERNDRKHSQNSGLLSTELTGSRDVTLHGGIR
jgi:hypothetical protein